MGQKSQLESRHRLIYSFVSLISKENLAIIVENSEGSDKQLMEYEEQIVAILLLPSDVVFDHN